MISSIAGTTRRKTAHVRRRDHLRRRAVLVSSRWWPTVSTPAILMVVAIDLLRHRTLAWWQPAWSQVPFVGMILFCVLTSWQWVRYRRRYPHPAGLLDPTYIAALLCCGLFGFLWGSTLIVAGTADGPLLRAFLVPTLIYSGILMAPVRAGAIAFVVLVTTGYLLSIPWDAADAIGSRALAIVYGLVSVAAIIWQSAEFARGIDDEIAIADQSAAIGIRLHEFEEQGSDWLWETDARFRLQAPSDRLCALLGCESDSLGKLPLRRWINSRLWLTADGREGFVDLADCLDERLPFRSVQIPVGTPGHERWLLLTGKPVLDPDGAFRGYRGVGSDITDIRDAERRIIWLARHDSLTGLPNRAHFHEALQTACSLQAETGEQMALLCLDLDGFKAINDTLGHLAGDALLAQVATRLGNCVRKRDLIGRVGGDEFTVLLVDTDRVAAAEFARRLMAHVSAPYEVDGTTIGIGLSIGIGIILSPDDAVDARDLLKGADLAMYRAKAGGRGMIRFFDTDMETNARNRLLLQADLRHAISRNEIVLHFQPIMHGITGQVVAVEALARWMHPGRGMIPPAEFIPIAEEFGLITELGAWVLNQACLEATSWPETVGVSVNLSPIQMRDPMLVAKVEAALEKSGLSPARLELELTESLLLESNPMVRETMRRLKQRRIRIALDDFGTGFSSLSYLRHFHVDTVKIDRSFVRDLGADPESEMIVQAITGMAKGLGITAEGVETSDQAARLRASGCTQFQGFLYSRPCTADAVRQFIGTQQRTTPELAALPASDTPIIAAGLTARVLA